jgi:hypothetical protein
MSRGFISHMELAWLGSLHMYKGKEERREIEEDERGIGIK